MTGSYRWLMLGRQTQRLWITAAQYTFEEVLNGRKDFPVCPLAKVQSDDYDAIRELVKGAPL